MRKGRGREESEGSYGAFESTVCALHTVQCTTWRRSWEPVRECH